MSDRGRRIRLGLFVATTLAGLVGLVVLFGGAPTLFSARARYAILFPEAPGIAAGTPVRKSGVRIGEVANLELDDASGQVQVNVVVDPKFLPRPSEEATISRGILSGDTTIDFIPRTTLDGARVPLAEPYPPGSSIIGTPPFNPRTLTGVIPTAQESVLRIMRSFERVEQAIPKVEKAIDEIGGLARASREFVPELRQTNARVQDLLGANEPAKPNDPASVRGVLAELIELLRAVRPAADELRLAVKDGGPEAVRTLRSIRTASENVNDLLNAENKKAVGTTLKNLSLASDDLTKTIRLAAILLDQGEKMVRELNARLVQSEKLLANLEKATKPAADQSAVIVGEVAETVKTINTAATTLNQVLVDLRGLTKALGRSDGTVAKVISDPMLYNNLNDSAASLARLLIRAEKVTRDLEVFADKIARKPELIGIGGALHPSTGLKESPFAPLPQSPSLPIQPPPIAPNRVPGPSDDSPLAPIPPTQPVGPVVPSYRLPMALPRPADLPPLPQ